ncbi:cobalamin biosynthesis protein CbiX [Mycobacterium sp. MFM001]|uniref:sirohydrochlorin chelatase n=1 Tax=Mycobacterium sp. MFM001 TaxID=2049453 RepID=UPI000DA57F30|nr:sirohydrochlorin chelatase [Mycobacterium sp. MFM001]GBE63643.1 cobalamin biosynthesis protein CbiX [Mycobacterium sp. MFM001]
MSLVLVVHGTRRPEGIAMIGDLVEQVGAVLKQRVHVGFVDVLGPTPSEILSDPAVAAEPAIVVPAFLSRGYHVRTDLPSHVATSCHPDVIVTPALGPSPQLARIVFHQMRESGWRPGDSVVLAAAGTSDKAARTDLRTTAMLLATLTGSPVELAFAATGEPSVAEAVAQARSRSARRVVVASYLLAEGLFQERLRDSGADVVSRPLGTDPALVRLIAGRFQAARACAPVSP